MLHILLLNTIDAAEDAIKNNINVPENEADNRVKTMNNFGYMRVGKTKLQVSTKQFLEIASTPGAKVLEIGAAYGEVCMEALRLGATDYTAVDLEENHLKILGNSSKKSCFQF